MLPTPGMTRRSTRDPTIDVVFKMLLTRPQSEPVLPSLLTAVLRPTSPIGDIVVLNPAITLGDADQRGAILDVAVKLLDGRRSDIEMQAVKTRGFRERALFYWSNPEPSPHIVAKTSLKT
jgi:predicted transposase/invertase (TIGR01784 family)